MTHASLFLATRMGRCLLGTALGVVALAGCSDGGSASPTSTTLPPAQEVTVKASDYTFDAPARLAAGAARLSIDNQGAEPHHAQLLRLDDEVTEADLEEAAQSGEPAALVELGDFAGGTAAVAPHSTSRANAVAVLEEGRYAMVCLVPGPDGAPHVANGMLTTFDVEGRTAAPEPEPEPAPEPDPDSVLRLVDLGFRTPEPFDGDATYDVANEGAQPHEVVVASLPDGADVGDVVEFLDGEAAGPPTFELVGGVQALPPGPDGRQQLDLDLPPGRYALVCAVPDPETGVPHYRAGMTAEVEVE